MTNTHRIAKANEKTIALYSAQLNDVAFSLVFTKE